MKKIIYILFFVLYSCKIQAQVVEWLNTTMETVQYDLPVLIVSDSVFLADLDSLLSEPNYPEIQDMDYKYLHVYIDKRDSMVQFEIELSKYPARKRKETIGFFCHNNRIFIISGAVPVGLFTKTIKKKHFKYRDYVQPSVEMLEDDLPTWIFNYENGRLSPNYP